MQSFFYNCPAILCGRLFNGRVFSCEEGLCVQILHIDSPDSESDSIRIIESPHGSVYNIKMRRKSVTVYGYLYPAVPPLEGF